MMIDVPNELTPLTERVGKPRLSSRSSSCRLTRLTSGRYGADEIRDGCMIRCNGNRTNQSMGTSQNPHPQFKFIAQEVADKKKEFK